ncbi:MAG: hypothetical protein SGJ21_08920 [Alphaproteobacteria bacterium]|nr:hypothetical protein [Alphaproteobacteria bacterium]
MEMAIGGRASRDVSRWFYAWMALACMAVAVLGFMPTYFMPMVQGRFAAPPIVHIHGMLFFSWTVLFCVQTWLVASGGTLAHRSWGLLGISIVTAMVFMTLAVVVEGINRSEAQGFGFEKRAFAWIQVSGMAFFGTVFTLAIVNLRKADVHKRLMLLATISLLDAPIARWFLTVLAPPPPAEGFAPPPPVFVSVPPAIVADLLLVAAIVYDWRTRGRPHPVYLVGGACLLALQLTRVPVSSTAAWQAIAGWIGAIGG